MATYNIATTTIDPSILRNGDILNCPYSGTYKNIILPTGQYKLEVWGAEGGSRSTSYVGGKGGYSCGVITLDTDRLIYLYAGGQGSTTTSTGSQQGGGFNGGGHATTTSTSYHTSGGGGGSDIRVDSNSLYARVIVAGGGGGSGTTTTGYGNGGYGGGDTGDSGSSTSTSYRAGLGGTQTVRGSSYYGTTLNSTSYSTLASFGLGASAKTSSSYSSGGGGGWYGGGSARRAAGGGGSGYVLTSTSHKPSGYLLGEEYFLTEISTQEGVRAGHGNIKITILKLNSINMSMRVGGDLKNYSEGWVRVDGSLRQVADVWVRVNGVLRKA